MTAKAASDTDLSTRLRIAPPELRWRCDPDQLDFASTAEVEPLTGVVGQDDAIEALRFGLEVFAPGQNIYVRGLTGTGRLHVVRRLLEEIQPACPLASDYAYVQNFRSPEAPRLLVLPRGRARAFRDAMERFLEFLKKELGPALSTDAMRARKQMIDDRFQAEAKAIGDPFEAELRENGLTMVTANVGTSARPMLLPLIDGEPAPPERIQGLRAKGALSDADLESLQAKIETFAKKLEDVAAAVQRVQQNHSEAVRELYRGEARALLQAAARPIRAAFEHDGVGDYIDEVVEDVLRNGAEELSNDEGAARRYQVNVLLGHERDEACPVIVETTPTLGNLLGGIDRRVLPQGLVISDHLMITAGSLLRADGGYLILEARDVLSEPGAWKVLVRTLRTGRLEIVPSELQGPWGGRSIKPEAIPINVKVILIGDPGLYYLLDGKDPDFPNLFKVLADFDSTIPRANEAIRSYAGHLARMVKEESLPHFDRAAVAALAEHGARIAGRNDKLTTRFGRLSDLAREAAFVCEGGPNTLVSAENVTEAIRRTRSRANLPARKFREQIESGTIRINTRGSTVGEVNGLAVIHAGPLVYGFPSRITATVGAGAAGVINIERESQLSGAIHTKGFYILGGLLRHLLRTQHPLAFSASIAFEQSYGGIDGDSASGAEMCCLMSALTEVPLRQDLAMTGAIDQHGKILPIGAATEKIEGFYDVCAAIGLTGTQGVIIPKTNVANLMLREDLVESCAAGRFHVYAVDTIHEALEIFTGLPTGERNEDGDYPEGSLLHTAVERAFDYWSLAVARPTFEEVDGVDTEPAEEPEQAATPEA